MVFISSNIDNCCSFCFHYRPQRSWGKVMFLQVCVILFTGGEYLTRYTPRDQVPAQIRYTPGTRYTPQTRYTPPGPGKHHPLDQVHPPDQVQLPGTRYTPLGPGTSPRTRYILLTRYTPLGPGTPPQTRFTPRD